MSGMRRNPRRKGSERAGSRPLETNVLSSINEYMECVLSLSRSCLFCFFWLLGSEQTKNLPGKSPVSVLEPCRVDTKFGLWVSITIFKLFLTFFWGGGRGGGKEAISRGRLSLFGAK